MRLYMQSTNTKNLTIPQLKRLIANNGLAENYEQARKQGRPTEYCLESLKQSLFDKQAKQAEKLVKLADAQTAANAPAIHAPAANSAVYFMPAPANPNRYLRPAAGYTAQAAAVNQAPARQFLFGFTAPLWQVEQVCSYLNNAALNQYNFETKKSYKFTLKGVA